MNCSVPKTSPASHLKIEMALLAAFKEGADRILAAALVKPQENVIMAVEDRHAPWRCHRTAAMAAKMIGRPVNRGRAAAYLHRLWRAQVRRDQHERRPHKAI